MKSATDFQFSTFARISRVVLLAVVVVLLAAVAGSLVRPSVEPAPAERSDRVQPPGLPDVHRPRPTLA
jgi:hypothetical protein